MRYRLEGKEPKGSFFHVGANQAVAVWDRIAQYAVELARLPKRPDCF
jgi:hypothetical protein